MALTDSLSAVAKYIQDMIDIKKVDLGLKHVYYGEQNKIPNFPAATVEAVEKLRTLNGAPRRTEIE